MPLLSTRRAGVVDLTCLNDSLYYGLAIDPLDLQVLRVVAEHRDVHLYVRIRLPRCSPPPRRPTQAAAAAIPGASRRRQRGDGDPPDR